MSTPNRANAPVTAVVTGAARGVVRGTALALAGAGATVYVTDRESRTHRHSALPGTVEDTAEEVTRRGGHGIPVRVDVNRRRCGGGAGALAAEYGFTDGEVPPG